MRVTNKWYKNQDDASGGIAELNDLTPTGVAPQVIHQGYTQEQLEQHAQLAAKAALYDQHFASQGGNDDGEIPDEAFESVDSLKQHLTARESALAARIRAEVQAELAPQIVNQHIGGLRDGLDKAGNAYVDQFLRGMDPASQAQVLSNPEVKNMVRNAARMVDLDSKTAIPGANGVAPGMTGVGRTQEDRELINSFAQNYNVSVAEAEKALYGGKK
jgi:hypothetical protein